MGLFAADGRHLGFLGMNTDDARHPTLTARDFVGVLAPMIGNIVDPLRSIAEAARIVHDAVAGIVLTAANAVQSLPGLPSHELFAVDSDLLWVVNERLASHHVYESFLCPVGSPGAPYGYVRITILSLPSRPPRALAAVLMSPPGNIRGLTTRELQILGLLVEGWPNQRIAAALLVTNRTTAAHIEHILVKLAAPTRTLAAVRALRHGLYVPRPLNGVVHSRRAALTAPGSAVAGVQDDGEHMR